MICIRRIAIQFNWKKGNYQHEIDENVQNIFFDFLFEIFYRFAKCGNKHSHNEPIPATIFKLLEMFKLCQVVQYLHCQVTCHS